MPHFSTVDLLFHFIVFIIFTRSCSTGVLFEDGTINNKASIARIAEVALAYAKAGNRYITLFVQVQSSMPAPSSDRNMSTCASL